MAGESLSRISMFKLAAPLCLVLWAVSTHDVRATQAPSWNVVVDVAVANFRPGNFTQVETTCTTVIQALGDRPLATLTPEERRALADAYEIRALARLLLMDFPNDKGSREDMRGSILAAPPTREFGRRLPDQTGETTMVKYREERAALITPVSINVLPSDATVSVQRLDDVTGAVVDTFPVEQPPQVKELLVGRRYRVTAERIGYRSDTRELRIVAGQHALEPISLTRTSSTLTVVTAPAGVDVWIGTTKRGTTERQPLPPHLAAREDVKVLLAANLGPLGVFQTVDVPRDRLAISLKGRCLIDSDHQLPNTIFEDHVRVVPMKEATAPVRFEGEGVTAEVSVDRERVSPLPNSLCAGSREIEFRSDTRRSWHLVDVRSGSEPVPVAVHLRPGVALLSDANVRDGLAEDKRRAVAAALQSAQTVSIFPIADAEARAELKQNQTNVTWLAFGPSRRPVNGSVAANMSAADRQEVSSNLAKRFNVEAVAEILLPWRQAQRDYLLTILLAGGDAPDVIPVRLDDAAALQATLQRLNYVPPVFEMSAGIDVLDAGDPVKPIVISQQWIPKSGAAPLLKGDALVAVDGSPIRTSADLAAAIAVKAHRSTITVRAIGSDGKQKDVVQGVWELPRVIDLYDDSLLFNKLAMDYGQLVSRLDGDRQHYARLNLAVALMRTHNWDKAKTELEQVRLPNPPTPETRSVQQATVAYLLGECLDALYQHADANAKYTEAKQSKTALLTANGPLIYDLAEMKLANKARRIP